jgi:glycosyltransferase involved in cell wall biosynthesis
MVVAHVLSSLAIGGGERVALELAGGQTSARHRVIVVSLAPEPDGPLGAAFDERGVPVRRVAKRPGLDPTLALRLAALFRREKVRVVHTHNRLPLVYGAAAGRLAGAVVIHTRHGPGRGNAGQRMLWRGAGRLLHAYVAVSPELLDLAKSLHACAPAKLRVIENGIDVDRFDMSPQARRSAREALGIPQDAFVIGAVGRLSPEKEFPWLVRTAASMLGPGVRLLIVGGGAQEAAVRAEVTKHQVEPFVLLPGARNDVPRYIAALDLFVLSSSMEGLPLAVLEAMAAGLPVVATAVGGLPNLIDDGKTGFLVPSGDETMMRDRLRALQADPALARAVGERGRTLARERYSRDQMVRRYLSLYAEMGAKAGGGADTQ